MCSNNFIAMSLVALSLLGSSPFIATAQDTSGGTASAELTFYVPPFAKLFIQDQEQRLSGTAFRLVSPPLERGKAYHYNVRSVWKENGSDQRIDRRVGVQAGQRRLVNLCGVSLAAIKQTVVSETNRERGLVGREPLVPSRELEVAAQKHADNMARQGILSHSLDGRGFMDRAIAEGYQFSAGGENIAEGAFSSRDVVGMWMRSPGHKENMLSADYSEIGIGTAWDALGRRYDVQVFGRPNSNGP